jgi:hypothetical protein
MKAEADRHFLMGINQLIGHGWPYTPEGIDYPGWRFYAAAVFDEKNPWWIVMPDIATYLQRNSYLLRQGSAVNDVALYLPNDDGWAHFTNGNPHLIEILRDRVGTEVISSILDAGYGFDFFDDDVLMKMGRTGPESLVLGSSRYRTIILPNVERIPLETMRKLEQLARFGVTVIATRRIPDIVPGLNATPADQAELHEITKRLFSGFVGRAYFVEDEKQLGQKLTNVLPPDLALSPAVPDIGFVHRRTSDADIYFVANTSNVRRRIVPTFRVARGQAEEWDPLTGTISAAWGQKVSETGTSVALDLEPYGSRVLIFSGRTPPKSNSKTITSIPSPIDLSTGWTVTIGDKNKPTLMDHLSSWTENETTRFFSGTATYEKEITVPSNFFQSGLPIGLHFGEGKPLPEQNLRSGMQTWLDAPVREAAVVYVNDRRVGSIWCPPYSIDVSSFVKPGNNQVRIVVANLALNYMAGRRLPDYRLLNLRYGERFQAQDMDKIQPIPSGLLGPIKLFLQVRLLWD